MFYKMYKKLVILFTTLFTLMIFSACNAQEFAEVEINIFSEIEECYHITQLVEEEFVYFHDDPSEDVNSNGLPYAKFVGVYYAGDDYSFRLFAYEFLDKDAANKYFYNETGKVNDERANFSDSVGMLEYRRIVVCDNKAYCVYADKSDVSNVRTVLNNLFTEQLFDSTEDGPVS